MESNDIALTKERNDSVRALEQMLLQVPQVDLKTQQQLNGGVYARTILIPAGTILTGATHKKDHINVLHGDITVTTDEGTQRLTGYHVIRSKAGSKRAGVAHQDTYWTTICATELDDFEAIEDELVEESTQLQTRVNALPATHFNELEK